MTSKSRTKTRIYAPSDGNFSQQYLLTALRASLGGHCSTVSLGVCTFAHATRALPNTQQASMESYRCPSMCDYSRRGLQALHCLHRAQTLRRLRRAQALRRLVPHWHLRRQLQRLQHPRWWGQNRQCQMLRMPRRRMLCPSRPSFRQQLQGQKHSMCHLPAYLPRRSPARLPGRPPTRFSACLSA